MDVIAGSRSEAVAPTDPSATDTPASSGPTLDTVCGLLVVLVAALIGTAELHDNSFLTHLATGRLLLDEGISQLWGGMADPYTSTAGGRNWIVQSWFASVLYAGAEDVAGAAGIRVLTALTCAALGGLTWRLTRPAGSLIPRVLLAGLVLTVGAATWTSRPFMFGLVCFALTMLVAEGGLDPRWLVPVGWVWVNTHGSFPLGIVLLVLLAVGRKLDGDEARQEVRTLRWSVAGIAAGGILNPVGPALLVFPVRMLTRSDLLGHIVEWESPDFADAWTRVYLLMVLLGIVAIVRRPSFRAALPFAVFLGASLLAMRNIHVAMFAFLPGVAGALAGLGSIDGTERRPILRPMVAVLGVAVPVLTITASIPGDVDTRGYPAHALEFLGQRDLLRGNAAVATQDYVGNFLELELGRDAAAFIDDRYELHDRALVEDYFVLNSGRTGWDEVLDRRAIDVVVWERDSALGSVLLASGDWRVAYDDTTAVAPEGVDEAEWQRMIDVKPFVVVCRAEFEPCFGN